jgi:hypothetical protein
VIPAMHCVKWIALAVIASVLRKHPSSDVGCRSGPSGTDPSGGEAGVMSSILCIFMRSCNRDSYDKIKHQGFLSAFFSSDVAKNLCRRTNVEVAVVSNFMGV